MTTHNEQLDELRSVSQSVRELGQMIHQLRERRNRLILDLYEGGHGTGRELAVAGDMAEARVYQILRNGSLEESEPTEYVDFVQVITDEEGSSYRVYVADPTANQHA